METKFMDSKFTSIEEEIRVLKSQFVRRVERKRKIFSSFEGIWRGKVDLSFDQIKKAEFKPKGDM